MVADDADVVVVVVGKSHLIKKRNESVVRVPISCALSRDFFYFTFPVASFSTPLPSSLPSSTFSLSHLLLISMRGVPVKI